MLRLAFGFAGLIVATSVTSAQSAPEGDADRGAYVALLGDCASCHGDDCAGGQPLQTPFGVICSNNITPDPETGIGDWDYEDFRAALREGLRKDGEPIYPVMPYVHYARMTDDDIRDLWAVLQSVDPLAKEAPENEMSFPFNLGPGLYAWRALYLDAAPVKEDPQKSAAWNRGRYIVSALAHCGACRTPRNAPFAAEGDQSWEESSAETVALSGAKVPGQAWYAPDISGGPGAPGIAADLRHSSAVNAAEAWNVVSVVVGGVKAGETYPAMPGLGGAMTDEEVAAAADYVRVRWGGDGGAAATSEMVATARSSRLEPPVEAACPRVSDDVLAPPGPVERPACGRTGARPGALRLLGRAGGAGGIGRRRARMRRGRRPPGGLHRSHRRRQ